LSINEQSQNSYNLDKNPKTFLLQEKSVIDTPGISLFFLALKKDSAARKKFYRFFLSKCKIKSL
jgi:hypothetical protein